MQILTRCHLRHIFRSEDSCFHSNPGTITMDTQKRTPEAQADQLVDEALHQLGDTTLDEPDEYTEQCDYAGCYPWLKDIIWVPPYELAGHDDATIDDTDSFR